MYSEDVVESLWVRIRGMESEGDVVVGIYYRSSSWDVSTHELFYRIRQLEVSGSVALVLMEDFNFPDISWEYHTAMISRSWKFCIPVHLLGSLDRVDANPLFRILS